MARQGLSVEQKRQRRRLKNMAKRYGFEWFPGTEQLAELPEELWAWVEERLARFVELQAALRSNN